MHEEADVGIKVTLTDIGRHQEQIVVMDPYHLFLLLQLKDSGGKLIVNVLVFGPELLPSQIVLKIIQTLEVMKERPQYGFMKVEKLLNCLIVKEDWHAPVWLE